MVSIPSTSLLSFIPFQALAAQGGFLSCRECPVDAAKYISVEELECHIAADHMQFFPYECEKCRFGRFPTLYALTSHCRDEHRLLEFHVKFKYNEEVERRLLEAKTRVFLSLHGSTAVAAALKEVTDDVDNEAKAIKVDPVIDDRMGGYGSPSNEPSSVSPGSSSSNASTTANRCITTQPGNSSGSSSALSAISSVLADSSAITFDATTGEAVVNFNAANFTTEDYQQLIGEAEQLMKKPKSVVNCQLCGLKVSNQRSSLVYHANTKHIRLNLYQCKVCDKTWQTIAKSDVIKHVKAVHNGDEKMIIDNRKKVGIQLRVFTQKCFPPAMAKPRGRPPLGGSRTTSSLPSTAPSPSLVVDEDDDLESLCDDAPMSQLLHQLAAEALKQEPEGKSPLAFE